MMIENGMEWTRNPPLFLCSCIVLINGAKIECGGYGCVECGTMYVCMYVCMAFVSHRFYYS